MPPRRKKASAPVADHLPQLLADLAAGRITIPQALAKLRVQPYEDLGFAKLDHHRALRKGFAEVVYCAGKTPAQVSAIFERLAAHSPRVLGTRATAEHHRAVKKKLRDVQYHEPSRCLFLRRDDPQPRWPGKVVIAAAGTSDLFVAEEAALTVEMLGPAAHRLYDVGVAGLHRLLPHTSLLQEADAVIAVAGMEGALPSVIAGLTASPVIAVPTSVGYGASMGGLAALLAMLNSCASGLAVVNIDNGFGAAYMAAAISRKIHGGIANGNC